MYKVLILGIGNESLGDYGVGVRVARYFERLGLHLFDVKYTRTVDFNLIDYIEGYEKVIIIEASEKKLERTYRDIFPEKFQVVVYEKSEIIEKSLMYSSHETSFGLKLQLAIEINPDLIPDDVKFIVVEIPIQTTYSNCLTKNTKKLALQAIHEIFCILDNFQVKIYVKDVDCSVLDEIIDIY